MSIREITHFIDGKPVVDTPDRTGEVFNPAAGTVAGHVTFADSEMVDRAVASACDAFATWRQSSLAQRTEVLFAYRELLLARRMDLAAVITAEHGKTLEDAAGEVNRGLEVVEYVCGIPQLLKGAYSEQVSRGVDTYTIKQPVGVCAGVTPFNFPAMVPLWMVPVAVACGNSFVLKPSEKDPSAGNLLAEWFCEAGLPDGVFNVVHGDRDAVNALLTHPDVASVSSVGSTPVARHIYETAAAHGKRVQALGGAKNHMVVLPDADLDAAADAAVGAGYGSAGQRCMAISVVVTVGQAADELVERLRSLTRDLKVGAGDEETSEMGPLVTSEHRDKVESYLDAGVQEGADLVADGRAHEVPSPGFYLGPSLFDRVTPEMSIYRDEIFGPVLLVARVDTFADAVELINSNPHANGTALFTRDGGAARRFQNEIEVGMVGVNVPIPVPVAFHSFGGWKNSLYGDLHVYGEDGIRFFTRTKVVTSRWPDAPSAGVSLNFPHG
ncbi:MAG: CoA-acylating methylmalonate-semialdehyde dehydrogenase [Actinobacteria bacterium]|nr:CoA-acylating methylmalonate-semialdehyde dehydrogenase [Actinomycetota bacterium]